MNGEDKRASPNLNTIHEEFDLSDRIKSLKGKHIKIKKIVKKEDGNYSIRESSLFSDKSMEIGHALDNSNPPSHPKDLYPAYPHSSNILPLDFNFQKQNSMTTTDYLLRKPTEYKGFGTNATDFGSGSTYRREPVMPLSSTYAPKDSHGRPDVRKDHSTDRIDIFSSG